MAFGLFFLTSCGPAGRTGDGRPAEPLSAPIAAPGSARSCTCRPASPSARSRCSPKPVTPASSTSVKRMTIPHSHRLELQLLQALAELHPGRQTLGLEMFARAQQPALDRWVARRTGPRRPSSRNPAGSKTGAWNFAYYRDLLNFAREKRIPVVALNAEGPGGSHSGKSPSSWAPKSRPVCRSST